MSFACRPDVWIIAGIVGGWVGLAALEIAALVFFHRRGE